MFVLTTGLSDFDGHGPLNSSCFCGWNCCGRCAGYGLSFTGRAVLSSIQLNRHFVLISAGCQRLVTLLRSAGSWAFEVTVVPSISSPYTNSVPSSGRQALPSFINTFTPVPAISSIFSPALLSPFSSSLALPTSPTFVPTTSQHVSVPTVF